jgi:Zn-dependent protease
MGWSWRIARLFGIDIYVHFTFVLLLAYVGIIHYLAHYDLLEALMGVMLMVLLFSIVVLHELGHALTARQFGIRTRDIILLPIGGVARLERIPEKPVQELLVAVAGPAVNVVLALLFFAAFAAITGDAGKLLEPPESMTASDLLQTLRWLFWVNVVLVAFNMLPAFPMDGGRVLRAVLAMNMDYSRATDIAARIGQGMAVLFGLLGLLFNPWLLFIALFVWIGAEQEAAMTRQKAALWGIPVSAAMITNFQTLSPQDTLADAARAILAGYQEDFPVVENGQLLGVLTSSDIIRGLAELGPQASVAEVMRRDCMTASPYEMVETVLLRMQHDNCPVVPVVVQGQIVGLLTPANVGEYIFIRRALEQARRRFDYFSRTGGYP